jgi:hypothetical protein
MEKNMKSNFKIRPKTGDDPAPAEIIEAAILDLAAGMKRLNSSRLKRETVVTLLHSESGVGKPAIRTILNNLGDMERLFLNPKPLNSSKK